MKLISFWLFVIVKVLVILLIIICQAKSAFVNAFNQYDILQKQRNVQPDYSIIGTLFDILVWFV